MANNPNALFSTDVDGVVAIGRLHFINRLDTGSVSFSRRYPPVPIATLKSLGLGADYDHYHLYKVGSVGGLSYQFLTNQGWNKVKELLLEFLYQTAHDPAGVLELENAWLGLSAQQHDTAESFVREMTSQLGSYKSSEIKLSLGFLEAFSTFMNDKPEVVLACLSTLGGKLEPRQTGVDLCTVFRPELTISFGIHLGYQWQSPDDLGGIFGLDMTSVGAQLAREAQVFHPLGIWNVGTATLKHGSPALAMFGFDAGLVDHIKQVRAYIPELMHVRGKWQRQQGVAGIIGSSAVFGDQDVAFESPYRGIQVRAKQLALALNAGLRHVAGQGGSFRIEVVFGNLEMILEPQTLGSIDRSIEEFRFQHVLHHPGITQDAWDNGVEQALDLLMHPTQKNIVKVFAAEAYITFLCDGGNLRLNYEALKLALGLDHGQGAKALMRADPDHMVLPQDPGFGHLDGPADEHYLVSELQGGLFDSFGLHLLVNDHEVAKALLNTMTGEDWLERDLGQTVSLVKVLTEKDLGRRLVFGSLQRQRLCRDRITAENVARCLLFKRQLRGVKGLQENLLHCTFANDTEHEVKVEMVTQQIRDTGLQAWPKSQPISANRDCRDEFWRIMDDNDPVNFRQYLTEMLNLFREDFALAGNLRFKLVSQVEIRLWAAMTELMNSVPRPQPYGELFGTQEKRRNFAFVWIIVMSTWKQQQTRGERYHPYIRWRGIMALEGVWHQLQFLERQGLLEFNVDRDRYEALFNGNFFVPPNFNIRVDNLNFDQVEQQQQQQDPGPVVVVDVQVPVPAEAEPDIDPVVEQPQPVEPGEPPEPPEPEPEQPEPEAIVGRVRNRHGNSFAKRPHVEQPRGAGGKFVRRQT